MAQLSRLTNLDRAELEELVALIRDRRQVVFEGPPGSGKTHIALLMARHLAESDLDPASPLPNNVELVQFHQAYGYEDFVQGIRPVTSVDGSIRYEVLPGVFKSLCATAAANPERQFVVVIDEINRGNVSRILGELLLLLEYRNQRVRLSYSKPEDEPFGIPDNVIVLGTMNTTDRSLTQIDYALRRRFAFYRLMPVVDGKAPFLERWLEQSTVPPGAREQVLRLFLRLNAEIRADLGEHFQVGHSYFMDSAIGEVDRQERLWRRSVMPLLEEYFHARRDLGDVLKRFTRERLLGTAGGD